MGAGSGNAVRRVLSELAGERWNIRLGGWWPGGAEIDHLVWARSGVGYAIEAEKRRLDDRHLVRGRHGMPVLRVGRSGGLEHQHGSAIVVPRIAVT